MRQAEDGAAPAANHQGGTQKAGQDFKRGSSLSQAGDNGGTVDKQGLRRVTVGRSSTGRCHHCSRVFETLTGAVSHGRSAGHLVEGTYTASYLYVPVNQAVTK